MLLMILLAIGYSKDGLLSAIYFGIGLALGFNLPFEIIFTNRKENKDDKKIAKKMRLPFCPNCGKEGTLEEIEKVDIINIKGVKIPIKVKINKCSACGEEFANLGDAVDYMNKARNYLYDIENKEKQNESKRIY